MNEKSKRLLAGVMAMVMALAMIPAATAVPSAEGAASRAEKLTVTEELPDPAELPAAAPAAPQAQLLGQTEAAITDVVVLDPYRSEIELRLSGLEPGRAYRIEVTELWSSREPVGKTVFTADRADQSVNCVLSGSLLELASEFELKVFSTDQGTGNEYCAASLRYANPYRDYSAGTPGLRLNCFDAGAGSFRFVIDASQGFDRWKSSGNIAELLDKEGHVVGRCTELSVIPGSLMELCGVMVLTEQFDPSYYGEYQMTLNGAQVDTYGLESVSGPACVQGATLRVNNAFLAFRLGRLPVVADMTCTSGRGRFEVRHVDSAAGAETVVYTGPEMTGVPVAYYDAVRYSHIFTEEELKSRLIPNEQYAVCFVDAETGKSGPVSWNLTYTDQVEFSVKNDIFRSVNAVAGDRKLVLRHRAFFDTNVSAAEVQELFRGAKLTMESGEGEEITLSKPVISLEAFPHEEVFISVTADLDRPLQAGTYSMNKDGQNFAYVTVHPGDEAQFHSVSVNQLAVFCDAPADHVYTAEIWKNGAKQSRAAFPLTGSSSEPHTVLEHLSFEKQALDGLPMGLYTMVIYRDGAECARLSFSLVPPIRTRPRFFIADPAGTTGPWVHEMIRGNVLSVEITDMGDYPWVRMSTTAEGLKSGIFEQKDYYPHTVLPEGDGEKALYFEFSPSGRADDPENIIIVKEFYLWTAETYGLKVPESLTGELTPESGNLVKLTASLEVPRGCGIGLKLIAEDGSVYEDLMQRTSLEGVGPAQFSYDAIVDQMYSFTAADGSSVFHTLESVRQVDFVVHEGSSEVEEHVLRNITFVKPLEYSRIAFYPVEDGALVGFSQEPLADSWNNSEYPGTWRIVIPKREAITCYVSSRGVSVDNRDMKDLDVKLNAYGPDAGLAAIQGKTAAITVTPDMKPGLMEMTLIAEYDADPGNSKPDRACLRVELVEDNEAPVCTISSVTQTNRGTVVKYSASADSVSCTLTAPNGEKITLDPAEQEQLLAGVFPRGRWTLEAEDAAQNVGTAYADNGAGLRNAGSDELLTGPDVAVISRNGERKYELVLLEENGSGRPVEGQAAWEIVRHSAGNINGIGLEGSVLTLASGSPEGTLTLRAVQGDRSVTLTLALRVIDLEGDYVAETTLTRVDQDTLQAQVTVTPPEDVSVPVTIWLAAYDADGRMSVSTVSDVLQPGMDPVTLAVEYSAGGTAKVFMTDARTGEAMCEPIIPR